ncbi:hypothetical protein MC885_014417 [Smutsia gigantea]|nr:hypothetical protein MC885_014417 [Smutsia gigantea]
MSECKTSHLCQLSMEGICRQKEKLLSQEEEKSDHKKHLFLCYKRYVRNRRTSLKYTLMCTGTHTHNCGLKVMLNGSHGADALGFLGYSPPENTLWPNLPVNVHLEVVATMKGLRKVDAAAAITRVVDALKLQDQLKLPVKALLEGIKRKHPGKPIGGASGQPSTGMDPEGQQHMWQAIQATFRNTERGTLLTTHYMAEAEAVCDHVAIMVSGRLSYSSLMVHKLPVEDSFNLEEYSLSQSTLEQVFLELSKDQELDDFNEEIDLSVRWKLLP